MLRAWIDRKYIRVKQSAGFGANATKAMRSVSPDWEWDGVRSEWMYPCTAGSLAGLVEVSRELQLQLKLDPTAQALHDRITGVTKSEVEVRKMIQRLLDDREIQLAPYTTAPVPPPWWHQQVAVHWGMRVSCLYLQLKPGLGKTRIGSDLIRWKCENGYVRPPEQFFLEQRESRAMPGRILKERWGIRGGVLVVCPSVVVGEWGEQLMRWQNIEPAMISHRQAEKKRYRAGLRKWVHVCPYDSLETVEDNEYDLILADELHYVANDEVNRFKRMRELRRFASGAIGLSGTPMPNMIDSLWAQYYWLDGGRTLGPSYSAYKRKYFSNAGKAMVPESEKPEAKVARDISRITMSMTMEEAFPGKPRKLTEVIRIPMSAEQRKYYEALRKQQAATIMGSKINVLQELVRLGKLMQVCQGFVLAGTNDEGERIVQTFGSAKLKALEEMVTGKGDLTDRKVVVWCQFKAEVPMIEEMLRRGKVPYLVLKAGMSEAQRQVMKDKWNTDPEPRVLVGSIAMGIGLNLHAPNCVDAAGKPRRCSTTVFYALNWKPTQLEQAMDRTYRGDQVEHCLYRFLLSEDLDGDDGEPLKPIDVRIYETLKAKMEGADFVAEESVAFIRRMLGA